MDEIQGRFSPLDADRVYIMQYNDGRRLKEIIRRVRAAGPTPFKEIVDYKKHFFDAISYEVVWEVNKHEESGTIIAL